MSFIRKIKKNGRIYLAEVKSIRIKGKPVQKFIKYVGKEVDGRKILSSSISNIDIESVKIYGPLIVLDYIAREINLHDILGDYSHEILSMVYAHCVEPRSINQMSTWFEKTDLNHILDLDFLTEKRLLDAIDSIEKIGRDELQMRIFNSVKDKYKLKMSSIFYDVTNTYLYGNKCILGKLGHSKNGKDDKPLVQIGLAVTQNNAIPVFHTVYDGNIHDSRTLHDGLVLFKKMNIKDIIVVYDRGITSKDGINGLKHQNLGCIGGLPIREKLKIIVRKIIREKSMVTYNNRIKMMKTTFYAVNRQYKIGDVEGKLLICYNDKMKHDIRESRYDEISHASKQMKKGKNIKGGLKKYFDKNFAVKKDILTRAEEFDGYSCLFCTRKDLSNETIIKRYFEKDLVEKAFRNLKGVVSLRPIRHWLYDRVVGHIFICYLSYLLLSLFQYRLEKARIDISVIEAMRELETLYKIFFKDNKKGFELDRIVKLNKIQENIMKAVNKKLLKM